MIVDFNEVFHGKGEDTSLGYHIIQLGKDFQHWVGQKKIRLGLFSGKLQQNLTMQHK